MTAARLIVALVLVGGVAAAVARPDGAEDAWAPRLTALDPARPLDYFELGEEVADESDGPDDRELAARLFGLAGALDPGALGRSAALALADLTPSDTERRRLLALASLLGGGGLAPGIGADDGIERGTTTAAVLAVTEAFSDYRRGRGPQALAAVRDEDAMRLLEACDPFLPGGVERFVEDCRHYRGQLRPSLSEAALTRMLRLEQALLAGDERSWSAELLFGGARPLIEVDPSRLADAFAVDPTRAVYRDGRWVEAP